MRMWSRRVKSRFYKYFFSYMLLVVIVLITMGGIVYQGFVATLGDEIRDSTVARLTQIKDIMDSKVNEMNRMALQISFNSVLTPFMVEENGYALYRTVSELKKYKSTNAFIDDVMLYYPSQHPGRLYAASGTYDADAFFESVYKFDGYRLKDLDKTLESMEIPVLQALQTTVMKGVPPLRKYVYIEPLSHNRDERYGAVLFFIEESGIRTIMQQALQDYYGFTYIVSERQEPLYRLENAGTKAAESAVWTAVRDASAKEAEDTVQSVSIEGHPYSIVRMQSDHNYWSYITVMPTGQFMNRVQQSKRWFEYTVAAVFVTGLIIAFAFSATNYRPLHRLVKKLEPHHSLEAASAGTDEYDFISRAVGEMEAQKEGLLHRLKSQASELKEQIILSLLHGRMMSGPWEERLALASMRFEHEQAVVLLFHIDDYAGFQRLHSTSTQHLLKYSLGKMLEELSEEIGIGYSVELPDNRTFALLLNLDEAAMESGQPVRLAEKLRQFLRHYWHLSVTVGIGSCCEDIALAHGSFLEASQAVRYRFIKGGGRIIRYEDVRPNRQSPYWQPLEQERELVLALRQARGDDARHIVAGMLQDIAERHIPLRAAELICFNLVNTLIKTLMELGIESDDRFRDLINALATEEVETMEALEASIARLCRELCFYMEEQTAAKGAGLADKLRGYVAEHYRDSGLSLESIAQQFSLSPSYVTRVFKGSTGLPLMRYIDTLRMEKAKELLRHTDAPLRKIMSEVGYNDPTNFIRKFKKSEGLTPIQYRNAVREG
ncbi:AraC family transcriptional regulator [Paenibacillus dendritiformis]|uniref:helix-turn-helix domain-containing protein n=1 Tax=Paenibacillus dendritiformis TaxID=130049 RepID=UPI00143D03C3|nr:helix-turn-helix domain-containing protein [Paenibacillus dendritiformis]NKI23563.1 AraC family transcriptional regulator [Paenibacillus dendritiformis]NRG00911.1 AraC family transcriptional regulator [Paenibacillus dendritiformis]